MIYSQCVTKIATILVWENVKLNLNAISWLKIPFLPHLKRKKVSKNWMSRWKTSITYSIISLGIRQSLFNTNCGFSSIRECKTELLWIFLGSNYHFCYVLRGRQKSLENLMIHNEKQAVPIQVLLKVKYNHCLTRIVAVLVWADMNN